MPNNNKRIADVLIIGSGVAATSTLIALFELLMTEGTARQKPLTVTIVERYNEMWKGVPYGNRSSVSALTITTLNDFFTADAEREAFLDWFLPHKANLLKIYANVGGDVAKTWLINNSKSIEINDWDNVYLPRFIIGNYLAQKLEHLQKLVEDKGLVDMKVVHGEAHAINQGDDIKTVMVSSGTTAHTLLAKKIVLAIGSAPVKKLTNAFDGQSQVLYINNLHEKAREETTLDIANHLSKSAVNERNILIIGSNASAIEFLYLLNHTLELNESTDNITVLSAGGKLPGHITYNKYDHFVTANLNALSKQSKYDLKQLVEAAMQDILKVTIAAVSVPDVDQIMATTLKLLEPLDDNSKKLFYAIHGVELARAFRRSGTDYKNAADDLEKNKKLNLVKGNYTNLVFNKNGYTNLCYLNENDEIVNLDKKFSVVINCTGAEDLENSSSALIQDLMKNNEFKVNPSRKAFLVNEQLEGTPDIYVIGPLAGGNFNKLLYFWHLENASRIIYLSKHLAPELLD